MFTARFVTLSSRELRAIVRCGILIVMASAAAAQTFTSLVDFNGADGSNPYYVALVQARDGNLYGTTQSGGSSSLGTVFRLTPNGTVTTVYSFCSQPSCTDGSYPMGGLALGTDGNLYGTTAEGGTSNYGTVFKITTSGTLTTLHSFISSDAAWPYSTLIQVANGIFLGTSFEGGAFNGGTVYEVTASGLVTTIYSFCAQTRCSDGADPVGALVRGSDGNFYGTTPFGGTGNFGTIFKISPKGAFTKLHDFTSTDGAQIWSTLIQSGSVLLGTAAAGGASTSCSGGCGTIFKVTTTGVVTTLHSFDSIDGASPVAGLIQGTDGNFYGTALLGGTSGDGTLFQSTASGAVTLLHTFVATDGEQPYGGLVQHTNGTFYGLTTGGGITSCVPIGCGSAFSESMGLAPFIRTSPTSGKVGSVVVILGTNLTGATSVTFNGTAATFTVVSSSQIKTTVPAGATTGKVQVTTPGGTLTSNVNFTVTK
jgi:uncharacterized repeat protein (TIGR03803 family)